MRRARVASAAVLFFAAREAWQAGGRREGAHAVTPSAVVAPSAVVVAPSAVGSAPSRPMSSKASEQSTEMVCSWSTADCSSCCVEARSSGGGFGTGAAVATVALVARSGGA